MEETSLGPEERSVWNDYETVFTNAKAGMENVDKEKVKKVVYEMSKDSAYFANEQRKEAALQKRIQNMRLQLSELSDQNLKLFETVAADKILELESSRDLNSVWMHVDMDAFYAAVADLKNPSLKGHPVGVGNMGMLSTANYEARKYGVRAAMPGFIAKQLCPQLIFVDLDFEEYRKYSNLAREVFQEFDPHFIACGLDEAYLNITNVCIKRNLPPEKIAEEIRDQVFKSTGLTCSAGIAPNCMLAKVCSDLHKPNGQFFLPSNRDLVLKFVSTLPIRKICGIGRVTERLLKDTLNVVTCGDLLKEKAKICALFSQISSEFFLSVGLGIGHSTFSPSEKKEENEGQKSISCERTFSPISQFHLLMEKLEQMAESLSQELMEKEIIPQTLTLKFKTTEFKVFNRSSQISPRISLTFFDLREGILSEAGNLLKSEFPLQKPLRLIGLRVSRFLPFSKVSKKLTLPSIFESFCSNKGEHEEEIENEKGGFQSSELFLPEDFSARSLGNCEENSGVKVDTENGFKDEFVVDWNDLGDGTFSCGTCGEVKLEESEKSEHRDFHLALELEGGSAGWSRMRVNIQNGEFKKKKELNNSIEKRNKGKSRFSPTQKKSKFDNIVTIDKFFKS